MKRLFVLLLVLVSFGFSYGGDMNSNLDSLAREQVKSKFADIGERPIRYYSNILILLQGYPTHEDSMIFNELVDTLNVLIDKWDVSLIANGTANLEVGINIPFNGQWKPYFNQNHNQIDILKSTVYLHLSDTMNYLSRKKIIFYNLLRALVVQNRESKELVSGSIFSELSPEKITFHPVDYKIIKALYSEKYEDINKFQHRTSTQSASLETVNYIKLFQALAKLLAYIFLILMATKGAFKNHHYEFAAFFKQGILVVATIAFLLGFSSFLFVYIFDWDTNSKIYLLSYSIGIFIIGILINCLIYLIEKAILKNNPNFLLHIMVPMLSISLITISLLFLALLIIGNIQSDQQQATLYTNIITSICTDTLLIGLGRSIFIFTSITSQNIIRKKDLELARMGALHKQAELQSLRAKINPHFLYNALNSIASLATTDGRKTEQMALSLSDFFKYAINREQKQLNSLSEELNAIRTYLEIEKVRFGERLNFEIDCPADLMEVQIPQLLIQPLVENALKHGLSQITDKGFIKVSISKEDNLLKIRVYDNGPAFPDGPLSGFGIQNTQERITLIYGAKAGMNWQNNPEKYIEISLPLNNK